MSKLRLACLLAKYLACINHTSAAILYETGPGSILAWSVDTRSNPFDLGTASVNLQRGCGALVKKNCQIVTSDTPEVVCLGMAVLTGITAIIHWNPTSPTPDSYRPGNALAATPCPTSAKPGPPDSEEEWFTNCTAALVNGKVQDFIGAFAIDKIPDVQWMRSAIEALKNLPGTKPVEEYPPPPLPAQVRLLSGINPAVDSFWMTIARRLAGAVHTGANLVDPSMRRGHNIGCVLVDQNNNILAWGVNTSKNNPTYHAETKCMWMFQHYYPNNLVPQGATLYTTLQSCLMCSATIKHACGANAVRVIYADVDKTPDSVLTQGGGAEEASLSGILTVEYYPLVAQHLLLARARWDKLRQAYQTGLFARAVATPSRAVIDDDIRTVEGIKDPQLTGQQDAAKTLLLAAKQGIHIRLVYTEIESAANNISNGKPIKDVENKLRTNLGAVSEPVVTEIWNALNKAALSFQTRATVKRLAMHNLEKFKTLRVHIDEECKSLPFTGGAPVLLQNPVIFEKLYQMPVIKRPTRVDLSTQILDISTQIHGLSLLIQVLSLVVGTYVKN